MKITFEGFECSFSMGAVSVDLDPKETEVIVNADLRKHEISEGDLSEQVRKCIFGCVKDAMGSAMAQQQPKDLVKVEDKPKPEPTACMPKPAEEVEEVVELEEPKKFGPKRRAQK